MTECLAMGHSKWGRLSLRQYTRQVDEDFVFRAVRRDIPRDVGQLLELAMAIESADRNSVDGSEGST